MIIEKLLHYVMRSAKLEHFHRRVVRRFLIIRKVRELYVSARGLHDRRVPRCGALISGKHTSSMQRDAGITKAMVRFSSFELLPIDR